MNINTFIFDLGGVIIDLDESSTIASFSKFTNISIDEINGLVYSSPIFQQYEKGLINDEEFRWQVRGLFKVDLKDEQIDESWNAMLGEIPKERIDLLGQLRKNHKVIILSNTNAIHIRKFNQILFLSTGKSSLNECADYVFFSHELNMRKPDSEIYEEILKLSATKPQEALFLDDKLENLDSAGQLGIRTMQISNPSQIFELRKYV